MAEDFCFVILPMTWLRLCLPLRQDVQEVQWHPEQNRWSQPPLLLSGQEEANVQPLARHTRFTRRSTMIRGYLPTLLPSQAVRPTVPYFPGIELLMEFAPLGRSCIQIPLLWICLISKPEVKPTLAIISSPNHAFNNHNNHTTHLWLHFLFSRSFYIFYLIRY